MIQEEIKHKYTTMSEAVKQLEKPSHTIRNYGLRLQEFKGFGKIYRGRDRGIGCEYRYNENQMLWLQKLISLMDSGYYSMEGGLYFTNEHFTKD